MRSLERRWRQFATGLSFLVFGSFGVLFGLTLFPLICLPTRDAAIARRRAQWVIHIWFWLFSRLMRALGVISWEIHGAEHLQAPGQLIIANHPTLIDVVLLLGYIPLADCIVKEALFHNPFTRLPVSWAGYISNSTPTQLVSDCVTTLRRGNSLMIFPEGTRSRPGQALQIPSGCARIAIESDAPIVSVRIRCEPLMLDKGRPWHDVPARAGHFRIDVSPPYRAARYLQDAPSLTIAARRLSHDWIRAFSAPPT